MTSLNKQQDIANSINYISEIFVNNYQQLPSIIEDAMDWAHCNGLILRTKEHKDRSDICQIAPFSLFPSPFPRRLFDQALSVQKALNLLYFKVSWDYEFLKQAHQQVIKSDEFTRRLMSILDIVYKEGIKQPITLLTQRADYMCHFDGETTENGISFDKFHMFTFLQLNRKLLSNPNAILLMVVEKTSQNQFDQRQIEYELEKLSEGKMIIIRLTLVECAERLILDEKTFNLLLGDKSVGIVYFRTGYLPEDYVSEIAWNARTLMERSTAIKCPWIGLQMANTKKIQQVLSCPGVLEKYLSSATDLENIRSTFASMWGLEHDDEETQRVIKDAIENPQNYVLKPQLEGGGGNYFDKEITEKLTSFTFEMRASHILMQRIRSLVVKNCLVRPFDENSKKLQNVVSELGIYGSLIGIGGTSETLVKLNKVGGHILRSKLENVNEGGIAVGAAVVDTPLLF
uniref:Glutathione synthetase n=1 Tax=Meloidogyne hapla TaxID=6305 RepID=A0A1I8B3B8_MELHA